MKGKHMPTITENDTATDTDDAFELDVQVTTDATVGYTVRRCDSSDTCGQTCGSACASS
jgi:FxLD family lantipeptide